MPSKLVSVLVALTVFVPLSNAAATPAGWTSLGCWKDDSVNRTLHYGVGSSPSQTVENCLSVCGAKGFALAGVEFASECYCGNAILYNHGGPLTSGCDMTCSGDATENCGGAGTINIYQNGNTPYTVGPASALPSYNGWRGLSNDVYQGQCYPDSLWVNAGAQFRLLKFHPNTPIDPESMSVQKCVDGCKASGYRAAGLEYGQECWCDTNHKWPIGDNIPNDKCSMPCTGNATEFCGAALTILVYDSF
ncbi:WSC domain-containing protein [Mycena floridula]|nr:WSC domain-containing protein [Mycena floridula]